MYSASYNFEILGIIFYIFIVFIVSIILVVISYIIAPYAGDAEKLSSYECGFEPFDDARKKFEIQFFLIAILFIVFDLEIAFLFPWVICLFYLPLYSFWCMMFFLGILTIIFVFEWRVGALDW